ncbi:MAG: hypothetical protein INF93_08390 [Rhodobacter sp.]|nr:hypothetical protein [Rhodobacter sp.]
MDFVVPQVDIVNLGLPKVTLAPAVARYLAPVLRRVIFFGKPHLGAAHRWTAD